MSTIKVYPTKASALNAHHPVAGAPRIEGVEWPYDVFTCRRLDDGSFTTDATKAFRPVDGEPAVTADAPKTGKPPAISPAFEADGEAPFTGKPK